MHRDGKSPKLTEVSSFSGDPLLSHAMAKMDFAPIADDYAFFVSHSTEAETHAAAYAKALQDVDPQGQAISMLDFGCGGGEFSDRLLSLLNWPPAKLRLSLVEPVLQHGQQAARRLARFSAQPVTHRCELPPGKEQFDVILSNHALYFVEDIETTIQRLAELLSPEGRMLLALAGNDHVLVQLWRRGFAELSQPVPYFTAEDVSDAVSRLNVPFSTRDVPLQIDFPDTEANRRRILRFLFGEQLSRLPPEIALPWFDPYADKGRIHIETNSVHFDVRKAVGP